MASRLVPLLVRRTAARSPGFYGLVTRQPRLFNTGLRPHNSSLPTMQWTPVRSLATPSKSAKSVTAQMLHDAEVVQKTATKQPGKFRQLMQQYGATGVVVYLGIGVVDLAATYFTIQLVGADKVKQVERWVTDSFGRFGLWSNKNKGEPDTTATTLGVGGVLGEMEAEVPAEGEQPSFASMFILAYGIHKTIFLPVRLGVTAVVTPFVVRRLQAMGWNIGRKAVL